MDTEAVVALVAAIAAALVTGVADYFIRKGDRAAQSPERGVSLINTRIETSTRQ